jgi:hypothetical protein
MGYHINAHLQNSKPNSAYSGCVLAAASGNGLDQPRIKHKFSDQQLMHCPFKQAQNVWTLFLSACPFKAKNQTQHYSLGVED